MKIYILIIALICLLTRPCYSQASQLDSTFSKDCNAKYFKCDSININNEFIKYFLVSKIRGYINQYKKECYDGNIIIYVERRKYKKKEFKDIFEMLSQKHNLARFWAFNSCKAMGLAMAAQKHSPEVEEYLENHTLGNFDIRNRKK